MTWIGYKWETHFTFSSTKCVWIRSQLLRWTRNGPKLAGLHPIQFFPILRFLLQITYFVKWEMENKYQNESLWWSFPFLTKFHQLPFLFHHFSRSKGAIGKWEQKFTMYLSHRFILFFFLPIEKCICKSILFYYVSSWNSNARPNIVYLLF